MTNLKETLARVDPVAVRYDFDGYGFKYMDSGSGSDWLTRIADAEPLYTANQLCVVPSVEAEGPQPVIAPCRSTCTGCSHLKTERWREYMAEDDEWDGGISARCGALPDEYGGKSISAYWMDNREPPSWCPFLNNLLTGEAP